tara:strand:+ start:1081 stop:2181 length:1101 start_codon:yes stop_codon:yes gene_type:complete
LIIAIKKKLLNLLNAIGYKIGIFVYGKITNSTEANKNSLIEVFQSKVDESLYTIFKIKNCRIYTDTVTDTAFIVENNIIEGPSFQHRKGKNADVMKNVVMTKGTPRIKKNIKGTVFSLLTGGGGNSNYWHWLLDVLPRINILENKIDLQSIDYFLFPDLREKFQKETLDLINIPQHKRISSKMFRHIYADTAIAVDHPYIFKNHPTEEIQNIPKWILNDLRKKFLKTEISKNYPKKIYIDRSDSKSNHRNLRKITNEDEIIDYLKKKEGFSVVRLGDFNFVDQVNLFHKASHIIGLHGAGFANLVFCKPNTFVLEFKSITAGNVIGNLARNLSINFYEISRKPLNEDNNQQGLISVPIDLIRKKLS